jgi:hypothetical protein
MSDEQPQDKCVWSRRSEPKTTENEQISSNQACLTFPGRKPRNQRLK